MSEKIEPCAKCGDDKPTVFEIWHPACCVMCENCRNYEDTQNIDRDLLIEHWNRKQREIKQINLKEI